MHVVIPTTLCVVSLVLLTNTLPTTVDTYLHALYSYAVLSAREEHRSTRAVSRRAADPNRVALWIGGIVAVSSGCYVSGGVVMGVRECTPSYSSYGGGLWLWWGVAQFFRVGLGGP